MGMTGNLLRIGPMDLEAVVKGFRSVEDFLYPGDLPADGAFELDKAWHGIHFLLAGDPWSWTTAAGMAVLGGQPVGEDMGYGPARYLTPGEVSEVASALESITREDLASRFDANAMANADIYLFDAESSEDEVEYFLTYYEDLPAYYANASKEGDAMLLWLA